MSRPPTFAEIGERIRNLREREGLTQEDLASALSVSRPVITKIELGRKALNSLELRRIADRLRTSTDFLTENVSDEEWSLRFRSQKGTDELELRQHTREIENVIREVMAQISIWRQSQGEH